MNNEARAGYAIAWTAAHPEKMAFIDLIVGRWGDGTSSKDRFAVLLECNLEDANLPVRVIDADPQRSNGLADRHLTRAEVVGQPVAAEVFTIIDAIWLNDRRIGELRRHSA